ncbi:MAG: hypothetical protein ACI905_000431 [Roseivirga sp.]|jgi:hypothetical protein
MRDLKVVEREPIGFEVQYAQLLYTSVQFLEVNNNLPQIHFWLIDNYVKSTLGHISFSVEEGKALSPAKAPFGGFSLCDTLNSQEISFFVFEVLRKLKSHSVTTVNIKLAPENYSDQISVLTENLGFAGFSKIKGLIYQAIKVDSTLFQKKVAEMENRKLKRCNNEGYRFEMLSQNALYDVFQFVKTHRDEKGYDFSMDWSSLKAADRAMAKTYLPAAVYDGQRMIAATIAVKASTNVLYNFSPAHDWDYNGFSPVVMLTEGLYDYCQSNQIGQLDLGTSYIDDVINKGLKAFKAHLGAETFFSHSYRKILSSH